SIFSLLFFNLQSTTEIYTLSLHDALPIYHAVEARQPGSGSAGAAHEFGGLKDRFAPVAQIDPLLIEVLEKRGSDLHFIAGDEMRSEEHTSELQSRGHLVCRLLLE